MTGELPATRTLRVGRRPMLPTTHSLLTKLITIDTTEEQNRRGKMKRGKLLLWGPLVLVGAAVVCGVLLLVGVLWIPGRNSPARKLALTKTAGAGCGVV